MFTSLFSSVAWAADVAPAAEGASGSPLMQMLPFVLIFVFFYFVMIRPQQKRQKEHQSMLNAVQKGDKIITNGGILGTVTGEDKDNSTLTVEIAPQVRIKISRSYVAKVVRPEEKAAKAKATQPGDKAKYKL